MHRHPSDRIKAAADVKITAPTAIRQVLRAEFPVELRADVPADAQVSKKGGCFRNRPLRDSR
jgi:hypothetical protein